MTDADLADLATRAGIAPRWKDVHHQWHDVGPDTLRAVLAALDLPASTPHEMQEARHRLARQTEGLLKLTTAVVDQPIRVHGSGRWQLILEDGTRTDGHTEDGTLPAMSTPGYHHLVIGGAETVLAVAPVRGITVQDAAPGHRPWVLAVQLYGLRRRGDGGLGDFRAVEELAPSAARAGAGGIAISPVHAQFSADVHRYSPYSPSSRVNLNVLHAGLELEGVETERLESLELVDWPEAARLRLDAHRRDFAAASDADRAALARFRADEGSALERHAVFEALHAEQFAQGRWHWRTWPAALQDPEGEAVRAYAAAHAPELDLHAWMQFRASQSLASAQRAARAAGMPIGLIADLAVGADSGGSHCWSRQAETLLGMSIGAPPDLLNTQGQAWGLAAFSPSGLRTHGYRAFIEMLRHAMRHAGGVRIDHALGLARLWVVPDGASARDGAYLAMPTQDLLRLIALESHRNRAIVLGEDLGTIPDGFQDAMAGAGMLGMRVLWFEKAHNLFTDPRSWSRSAAAMTSTHDLATIAGWWSGHDLAWRSQLGVAGDANGAEQEAQERITDRAALWAALHHSGAAQGEAPPPSNPAPVVDAALRHMATAACELVIVPAEDALGLAEQPNLPGTMGEHPNWRRRLPGLAATLLDDPAIHDRLAPLNTDAIA